MADESKRKKSSTKDKKVHASLLSFGADEEDSGDAHFVMKKKKALPDTVETHTMKKSKKRNKKEAEPALPFSNMMSSVGMYTPEMMSKLKGNAIHIKSQASARTTGSTRSRREDGENDVSRSDTNDSEREEPVTITMPMELEDTEESVDQVSMRVQLEIDAAKRKRERLRTLGVTPASRGKPDDFIPLDASDGTVVALSRPYGEANEPTGCATRPESGLVGEDPDDLDLEPFEEEAGRRIGFGDPGRRTARAEAAEGLRQSAVVEEDDEIHRWENEQIRKGGVKRSAADKKFPPLLYSHGAKQTPPLRLQSYPPPLPGSDQVALSTTPAAAYYPPGTSEMEIEYGHYAYDTEVGKKQPPPPPPPPSSSMAAPPPTWAAPGSHSANVQSVEVLSKNLRAALAEVKAEHVRTQRRLQAVQMEITEAEQSVEQLDKDMIAANDQYLFYQRVRDQMVDFLACLHEKAPLVEEAGEELKDILVARAKAAAESFALHRKDMEDEAFGTANSDTKKEKTEREVDEFGRDLDYVAEQGRERRAQIREERRNARLLSIKPSDDDDLGVVHDDGWQSDDDTDSTNAYQNKVAALLHDADLIFTDAQEEFTSFETVQKLLEEWKRKYPQAYADAFISLSVPSLMAPYVRLELLHWDIPTQPTFEKFRWYQTLMNYGVDEQTDPSDTDFNLVPKLVEKLVVPIVLDHIKYMWDPFSLTRLSSTITVVQEIIAHVEGLPNSVAAHDVRTAVMERYQRACNTHLSAHLVPKSRTKTDKQWAFCREQWWRGVKLLRSMCMWRDAKVLKDKQLYQLASSHMTDSLLPHFKLEWAIPPHDLHRVARMSQVLQDSFPLSWIKRSAESSHKAQTNTGPDSGRVKEEKSAANDVESAFITFHHQLKQYVSALATQGGLSSREALAMKSVQSLIRKQSQS